MPPPPAIRVCGSRYGTGRGSVRGCVGDGRRWRRQGFNNDIKSRFCETNKRRKRRRAPSRSSAATTRISFNFCFSPVWSRTIVRANTRRRQTAGRRSVALFSYDTRLIPPPPPSQTIAALLTSASPQKSRCFFTRYRSAGIESDDGCFVFKSVQKANYSHGRLWWFHRIYSICSSKSLSMKRKPIKTAVP